jgi:hypothetical protein
LLGLRFTDMAAVGVAGGGECDVGVGVEVVWWTREKHRHGVGHLTLRNRLTHPAVSRTTPTTTAMASERNPKTTHYEFFGPPGAAFVSLTVPLTIYGLYFTCSEASGGCPPPLWSLPFNFVRSVRDLDWWASLFDGKATAAYFAWYAFTVLAWYILPGDWVEGPELRSGGRLSYKVNGRFFLLFHFSS